MGTERTDFLSQDFLDEYLSTAELLGSRAAWVPHRYITIVRLTAADVWRPIYIPLQRPAAPAYCWPVPVQGEPNGE